ncbi:MAG: hypothetical protein U0N17_02195, partial [Agathobaculum butyriciproducens]
VGQLEDVTSSKKTKLNGTEYKLDSEPENLNVIEPNTNTSVKLSTLEAATAIDKVAGTVKLVDTDGNNKADTVVYTRLRLSRSPTLVPSLLPLTTPLVPRILMISTFTLVMPRMTL